MGLCNIKSPDEFKQTGHKLESFLQGCRNKLRSFEVCMCKRNTVFSTFCQFKEQEWSNQVLE